MIYLMTSVYVKWLRIGKNEVGILLFAIALLIATIIFTNKFYIALKNGYMENKVNRRKLITGVPYYFRLLLYFVVIIIGYTIVVVTLYFNWHRF